MIAATAVAWGTFSLIIIAALAFLTKMAVHLWKGLKSLTAALSASAEAVGAAMGPIRDEIERINEGFARVAEHRRV